MPVSRSFCSYYSGSTVQEASFQVLLAAFPIKNVYLHFPSQSSHRDRRCISRAPCRPPLKVPSKEAFLQVLQQGRYGERRPFPEPPLECLSVPSKKPVSRFLSHGSHRTALFTELYLICLSESPLNATLQVPNGVPMRTRYPPSESSFTYPSVYPVKKP
jgi:hypothetical protein